MWCPHSGQGIFASNLARLKVGLTEQTGTNIGSVLSEGINRLRTLKSKSKILILLTDGKDEPAPKHSPIIFAEGPKRIRLKSIPLPSVQAPALVPIYTILMRDIMRYKWNSSGRVAEYPVDKEILQEIAQRTEAKFFEAGDKSTLRSIYDEIDQLEKTDIQLEFNALYEDLYQWPLASGFILLIVGLLLERSIFLRIP